MAQSSNAFVPPDHTEQQQPPVALIAPAAIVVAVVLISLCAWFVLVSPPLVSFGFAVIVAGAWSWWIDTHAAA